jgi:hypothetical protein
MTLAYLCVNGPNVIPKAIWLPSHHHATRFDSSEDAGAAAKEYCPEEETKAEKIDECWYVTKISSFDP